MTQPVPTAPTEKPDFFVSRTGPDVAWAQWIAWQLEAHGYTVIIQDWDFGPGVNFVHKMQQAATDAERTVAVLSPRYFQSTFTEAEWTAAFYRDTTGEEGRLLPIRVEKFDLPGMFGPRNYLDLFDLDPSTARTRLLDWIARAGKGRVKPQTEPNYPGTSPKPEPNFPGTIPPIFGLPARNLNFTGREALLRELRSQLVSGNAVAAHGLGGTGKSQLAIEYAWRWASDYSRVLFVRAETSEVLGADFDKLADDLALFSSNKPTERAVIIGDVRRHLERNPRWLLIFDNAVEPRAIENVLPRLGGQVILTSRYSAWGASAVRLPVDVWPPGEAEQFLIWRVGSGHQAAAQLSEELGRLPLALAHATAYCEQCGLGLEDYIDRFRKHRLKLFDPKRLGDERLVTVTTTWSLSFDAVRQKSPAAVGLLELLAFFAPDRFPLDALIAGDDFLPEALGQTVVHELLLDDAISELLRYSLVTVEGDHAERMISVHRLVQEVTRERLVEAEKARWITAAVQIVDRAFPSESDDIREWPACARLTAQVLAVLQYAEVRPGILPAVTASLLNRMGSYAWSRADFSNSEALFQRALAIREKVSGPGHPDTANSLNNLGGLYRDQGRYADAEPLLQRAVAIREKVGPDHPDTANSVNNLALLFRNQGRYVDAESLFQRALAIREKALREEHPDTATSINNLASLYYLQSRYKQAESLFQRALAIRKKLFRSDHPDTADSLNDLALLYRDLGRTKEAEPLLKDALTITENALGRDHPHTATSLNNLALLYRGQGHYEKAEQLHKRALAIREKALNPGHPHIANSLNNLAMLYCKEGRYAEAGPLFQRALAIREKALGPSHPLTTAVLNNYAALLRATGRGAESLQLEAEVEAKGAQT